MSRESGGVNDANGTMAGEGRLQVRANSFLLTLALSIELCWSRNGDVIRVWERSSEDLCLLTLDLRHAEAYLRGEKYEISYPELSPESRACAADRAVSLVRNGEVRCSAVFSPRDGDGIYVRGRFCGPQYYRDPSRLHIWFVEYCDGRKRADWRDEKITLLDEEEPSLEALEMAATIVLLRHS